MPMFSFLDAMVCTVGALLVLLHAFARHGSDDALRKAEALTATGTAAELAAEAAEYRAASQTLAAQRDAIEAALSDDRLRLSQIEDHERQLLARLEELKIAHDELDQYARNAAGERPKLLAELEQTRARMAEARKRLDEAQQAATKSKVNYAVVAYDGRNGTRRRPIYVECLADRIVLQPEGVEIHIEDFAGIPSEFGNPLASALRAYREHWARHNPALAGKREQEPYPLLLVRPDGIESYEHALAAITAWGTEYGYEPIGADWQLTYPSPDPMAAELERQAIADARQRMQMLAQALRHKAGRQRNTLRASARGGFVLDGDDHGAQGHAGRVSGSRPGGTGGSRETHGRGSDSGSLGADGTASPRGLAGSSEVGQGSGLRFGQGTSADGINAATSASKSAGVPSAGKVAERGSMADSSQTPTHPSMRERAQGTGQGSGPGGSADGSDAMPHASKPTESVAKKRGTDWALRDKSASATPVERPIRVECHADRLVILPDDRNNRRHEIALVNTSDAMDSLADAVQQHMRAWGNAGKAMYWRPTLAVDVKPGGAERFVELSALLADSGLDVRERQPATATATQARPR